MKRYLIPAVLLAALLFPMTVQAAETVVVPVQGTVAAEPTPARRDMTRAERKLARDVIADAAEAAGMRRLEFMRKVNAGDTVACEELKVSLAAHPDAREIDIDRLRELLDLILEFIAKLLSLFALL